MKPTPALLSLLMLMCGCSDFQFSEEDLGKMNEGKKSSETDKDENKNTEAMIPKALHDDLLSGQEARYQELNLALQKTQGELQSTREDHEKLLAELAKLEDMKLALAATQEERNRIMAEAENYKKTSLAAKSAQSASSSQSIQQLTASNTQLSQELLASTQRVEKLELSVSRIQNPANMLKIRQLTLEKEFLSRQVAGHEEKIKELQTSVSITKNQENLNTIRQLKSQNSSLTQSLARSEKRLKEQQALRPKPVNPVDPNLVKQLKSQNAKLSSQLDKLRKQVAKPVAVPKDNLKTLAEWKQWLTSQGLMNVKPTPAQLAKSVGKPHDKANQVASGDGDEAIFIWNALVKAPLEIRTIDGKIETISYQK
tara:strand:- start:8900 stop:10006 length:1107 start_codon:yes stop_codon:yes gene_type:complete